MKREKYSLVFRPNDEIVGFIRKLKLELKKKLGWFNSVGSEAHITLFEFEANEAELIVATNFLHSFCAELHVGDVMLDHFGYYPTVLYIGPDTKSKILMKNLTKKVANSFPLPKQNLSNDPHISIGRGLNSQKIEIGLELFKNVQVDFFFDCDSLFLRKFNGRQFDVINRFRFGNAGDSFREANQLSLFE